MGAVSGGMSTLPRKWKRDAILQRSGDGPINREKRGSSGIPENSQKEWDREKTVGISNGQRKRERSGKSSNFGKRKRKRKEKGKKEKGSRKRNKENRRKE